MNRLLLHILLIITLSVGVATSVSAFNRVEIIELEQEVKIISTNNSVRVIGGNGQNMEIYNVTGIKIKSVKVDGADKIINLSLPTGCYIVKIGKVARKISLK